MSLNEMEIGLLIGGGVLLIILFFVARYLWKTYNLLVLNNIRVDRQSAHVEVHLKKKFDMIPVIVETVLCAEFPL